MPWSYEDHVIPILCYNHLILTLILILISTYPLLSIKFQTSFILKSYMPYFQLLLSFFYMVEAYFPCIVKTVEGLNITLDNPASLHRWILMNDWM